MDFMLPATSGRVRAKFLENRLTIEQLGPAARPDSGAITLTNQIF
jgi:hypothetical protein